MIEESRIEEFRNCGQVDMKGAPIRVLLIEDDPEDYFLVKSLLERVSSPRYELHWVSTYEAGLEEIGRARHEVCLVDYRLGIKDGLDLLAEAREKGYRAPLILLTGQGDYLLDLRAMELGASDYLSKKDISSGLLERSIRYAIMHKEREVQAKRVEEANRELVETLERLSRTEEELRGQNEELIKAREALKSLSSKLLSLQEDERKRIAKDLHDTIGQSLAALKYGVENAIEAKKRGETEVSMGLLERLVAMVQNGMEETRRIYMAMRPTILDDLGIIAAIEWFCREFKERHPGIYLEETIAIQEAEIPRELRIVIFRIIQEALANVAEHSKAELVGLSLCRRENAMELVIEDNGTGFAPESVRPVGGSPDKGLGIASMRERAELSGGALFIEHIPGDGTRVRASWPFPYLL